jgi:phosphate-selective porin
MRYIIAVLLLLLFLVNSAHAWEVRVGERVINIFNYLQVRYTSDPSAMDQFTIPRARIDVWGDVNDKLGYFTETDLMQSPALVYGWIDLKYISKATLRLGKFYYPFGLEYTTPPSQFDTINCTTTLWNLFGYSRDIGMQLSGKFEKFKYYLAVVNGADNSSTDNNKAKDVVGRVVFTPLNKLALGVSYYGGKSGTMEAERVRVGGEINYNEGSFSLKGEYISAKDGNVNKLGWYLQPAYNICNVQGLARYESWDPDLDISGDKRYIFTLGINWFFDLNAKLQVNYEIKSEETNEVANNALLTQLQLNF